MPGKKSKENEVKEESSFKHIVRMARTDINGHKTVDHGLTSIKGIGYRISCIISDHLNIDRKKRMGDISDEEEKALSDLIENDLDDLLPEWIMNRSSDPEFGDDRHVVSNELEDARTEDIDRLKKMHCYKGIRHMGGKKVRGQRTKSNGRKGLALGVKRKK